MHRVVELLGSVLVDGAVKHAAYHALGDLGWRGARLGALRFVAGDLGPQRRLWFRLRPGSVPLARSFLESNLALLFDAEINAEIERAKEIAEGLPELETLNLPPAH